MRKRSGTLPPQQIEVRGMKVCIVLSSLREINQQLTISVLFFLFQASSSGSVYGNQRVTQDDSEQREEPIVEVMTPEVVYSESRNPFSRIWSRSLRIKIIGRDGFEKLDVRIPVSLLLLQPVVLHLSEELMQKKTCLRGWSRPDSWKVSPTLFQVFQNSVLYWSLLVLFQFS